MTLEKAIRAYMSDHPRQVLDALKGDYLAVDAITRNLVRYLKLSRSAESFDRVEAKVEQALQEIEDGDRPLYGYWRHKSCEDLEYFISTVKTAMEASDNPYFTDVMGTQWDEAYSYWVLKGGHHVKDSPLQDFDGDEEEEVDLNAF